MNDNPDTGRGLWDRTGLHGDQGCAGDLGYRRGRHALGEARRGKRQRSLTDRIQVGECDLGYISRPEVQGGVSPCSSQNITARARRGGHQRVHVA